MKKILCCIALTALLASRAHAQITPETGYWWNPAEPGRGYVIEQQGTAILFAGFLYDYSKEALWVTASGSLVQNLFNAPLMEYFGGQTLTGTYQAPGLVAYLGQVQITFTANNQATLTWPGGTIPIQRYDIVPGGSSLTQPAGLPQTGWWYNLAEGGRGFAIEVQGNTMYLAGYMYDDQGNAVWYLASGPMLNSTTFSGVWQQYGNGQPLVGPFQLANIVNANEGSVTLQFSDSGNATLTLPNGRTVPLTRFRFTAPAEPAPGQWQPPAGATPASGNYIYLAGQDGDYIVGPNTYVYTQADSTIQVQQTALETSVQVTGDQSWSGTFFPQSGLSQLQVGFYPNVNSYSVLPDFGHMGWSGESRGCDNITGWFAVDNVAYAAGALTALDLRFEQHCDDAPQGMNGKIHWSINDPTVPPGPVNPIPPGLWQPPAGSTPASGNYMIFSGANVNSTVPSLYLYTPSNASVQFDPNGLFTPSGGLINIFINQGNVNWTGTFETMNTISQFQVGYYGGVERARAGNPVKGGIDWSSNITGACNTLSGWFAVDNVAYSGTIMTELDARFEQVCDLQTAPLYGKVHWVRPAPPAPQLIQPVPDNLWQPPAGATPASGNYLYVQSDPGDAIGLGMTYTYPNPALQFYLWQGGTVLEVVQNSGAMWTGNFQTIGGAPLQAGYYANLMEWVPNITTSGMSVGGNGQACDNITGWFAIDDITLVGSTVTALDLRFEQHCEGRDPALHGKIHYSQ